MALLPAFRHDYSTIVLEVNQMLFIKETPLKLIEKAAIKGGADYRGRRKFVIHLLGVIKKVPIPIDQTKQIYAFPSQSPGHINCCWIFYQHVESIQKPIDTTAKDYRSIIVFHNGKELPRVESTYVLEKQMFRTWKCIMHLMPDYPNTAN
ncbi:MAG: competence protein ComK [Bacillus sp. (in: firmicutes)]